MKPEIQPLKNDLPFAIIGMGLTGEATLKMLLLAGVSRDQIKTFDEKKNADFSNTQTLMTEFKPKTLIVSPGIALKTAWIQEAKNNAVQIRSELELATYFLTTEKVISITGSIGKSTTTALLGKAVKAFDPHSFMGGNFGIPLAEYVCDILQGKPRARYLILELSSFQLENYTNLKSDLSVLTFLSANHLERYDSKEQYYETKLSLLDKTKSFVICNERGGDLSSLKAEIKKRHPSLDISYVDRKYFLQREKKSPQMVGEHNLDNLALAYAVADKFSWPASSYAAMLQFPGLNHRLENCGSHQGILFLNDSKSTTIDSVLEAVQSMKNEKSFTGKIHLLLGGRDKNLPWENLSSLKSLSRFEFHFFGEYGSQAQKKSGLNGDFFKTLSESLKNLKSQIKSADIVLLSPGGTSLDEFKGFEDRGNFFKAWVSSEFNN